MERKMFFGANNIIFENAKYLRKNMTEAEKLLWSNLKSRPLGFKFRRQHPMAFFIADFYCHRAKLVIELDGSIHNLEEVRIRDVERQRIIEELGIKVIRFTNKQVFQNLEIVQKEINDYLLQVIGRNLIL